MQNERRDCPESHRPALIVTYGCTSRKHRVLERDIVVLGRIPGCDVMLASPEVSPVHCVLARGPHGWRVRNLSDRVGTSINGNIINEASLKDGDTLQVGTFSFEAHLPLSPTEIPSITNEQVVAASADNNSAAGLGIRARELMHFAEHLRRREQEIDVRHTRRLGEIAKAEAALREQRSQVVRLMTEMSKLGRDGRAKPAGATQKETESLRQQLATLKRNLTERDSTIAELRVQLEQSSCGQEVESIRLQQEEIEREQAELRCEREELEKWAARIRQQEEDFEGTTRDVELQMARERVQMVRDRSELEQLRDSIRFEQQRLKSEKTSYRVPEAVVGLKEEQTEEEVPAMTPLSSAGSHPGSAKWRVLRSLGELTENSLGG